MRIGSFFTFSLGICYVSQSVWGLVTDGWPGMVRIKRPRTKGARLWPSG